MRFIKHAKMYISFAILFVFTILALPFFIMVLIITSDQSTVSMILEDIGLALRKGAESKLN